MSSYPSLETNPLRILKQPENVRKIILGPPGVYPQEYQQKEDKLSESNVREGFCYNKPVSDEYDSAKSIGIDFISRSYQSLITNFGASIVSKNHNYNKKDDLPRKKNAINTLYKELLYVPAIEKNKEVTNDWMKSLADCVPYSDIISKRIPYFHKKEDVLKELIKFKVPVTSGVWFIKVTAMLTAIQADSNKKKTRANVDSSSDWKDCFMKILSEKFEQICEKVLCVNETNENEFNSTPESTLVNEFEYLIRLMITMFDEDLLEHCDILWWFVEKFEQCKTNEFRLKFFVPFLLQFGDRFKESEYIVRRLLYHACKSFNELIKNVDGDINEYANCPLHKPLIMALSGLIASQSIQMPSAVIWNDLGNRPNSSLTPYLDGSPLDLLPCRLSALPIISGPDSSIFKEALLDLEEFILVRSEACESRWQSTVNSKLTREHEQQEKTIKQSADIIDLLDKYDFSVCKEPVQLESLLNSIKDLNVPSNLLLDIVCQWCIQPLRIGTYRPIVAAHIIDNSTFDSNLQSLLVEFLDQKAVFINGTTVTLESESFRNLVCLFGELIDRGLFSPGEYISYMIARGMFEGVNYLPLPPTWNINTSSTTTTTNLPKSPDLERYSLDNPDSNRSDTSLALFPTQSSSSSSNLAAAGQQTTTFDYKNLPRHIQYLTHFPIPHNDDYCQDHNLRAHKLYHTLRNRQNHDTALKRLTKYISKMFTRRAACVEIVSADPSSKSTKKKRVKEDSANNNLDKDVEVVTARFRALSFYDMEYVLSQVGPLCLQALAHGSSGGGSGGGGGLLVPSAKAVGMLLALYEAAANYTSLVRFVDEALQLLHQLELGLRQSRHVARLTNYALSVHLGLVAPLTKHLGVLLAHTEPRRRIFQNLLATLNTANRLQQAPAPAAHNNNNHLQGAFRCCIVFTNYLVRACSVLQAEQNAQNFVRFFNSSTFRTITVNIDLSRPASSFEYIDKFGSEILNNIPTVTMDTVVAFSAEFSTDHTQSASKRLSFVVNIIKTLSSLPPNSSEHLAKLCTMLVECVSLVPGLCLEFVCGLFSLIMPFSVVPGYERFAPLFRAIISHSSEPHVFLDNISVLIATMLARSCFQFFDFLTKVLCVAMTKIIKVDITEEIEPTIRFATLLIYRLFTLDSVSPSNGAISPHDAALLRIALQKVTMERILDLLKILSFPIERSPHTANTTRLHGDTDRLLGLSTAALSLKVLRRVCALSWVRQKFVMTSPDSLIHEHVLLDSKISANQARNILHAIYNPSQHQWRTFHDNSSDSILADTFHNLSLWTLLYDQTKIKLCLVQSKSDKEELLHSVSRHILALYQSHADKFQLKLNTEDEFIDYFHTDENPADSRCSPGLFVEDSGVYLVHMVIARLQVDLFKQHLAQATARKLESVRHFATHKNAQDKEKDLIRSSVILSYPPFMSLLRHCLTSTCATNGNNSTSNDFKGDFLKSLAEQMDSFVENAKETEKIPDDLHIRNLIHESVSKRLVVMGMLWNRVTEQVDVAMDWCVALTRLVVTGVVESVSEGHGALFYSVLDMLAWLLRALQAPPHLAARAQQLAKRLRKELQQAERLLHEGTELLRPLLCWPCPPSATNRPPHHHYHHHQYDLVVCEPLRVALNRTGAPSGRVFAAEKLGKEGCVVARKERLSPWELIDGIKGLLPLSWFAGVSLGEHTCASALLPYEEQAQLLIGHTHGLRDGCGSLRKKPEYYQRPLDVTQALENKQQVTDAMAAIPESGGEVPGGSGNPSSNSAQQQDCQLQLPARDTPGGNSSTGPGSVSTPSTSIPMSTTPIHPGHHHPHPGHQSMLDSVPPSTHIMQSSAPPTQGMHAATASLSSSITSQPPAKKQKRNKRQQQQNSVGASNPNRQNLTNNAMSMHQQMQSQSVSMATHMTPTGTMVTTTPHPLAQHHMGVPQQQNPNLLSNHPHHPALVARAHSQQQQQQPPPPPQYIDTTGGVVPGNNTTLSYIPQQYRPGTSVNIRMGGMMPGNQNTIVTTTQQQQQQQQQQMMNRNATSSHIRQNLNQNLKNKLQLRLPNTTINSHSNLPGGISATSVQQEMMMQQQHQLMQIATTQNQMPQKNMGMPPPPYPTPGDEMIGYSQASVGPNQSNNQPMGPGAANPMSMTHQIGMSHQQQQNHHARLLQQQSANPMGTNYHHHQSGGAGHPHQRIGLQYGGGGGGDPMQQQQQNVRMQQMYQQQQQQSQTGPGGVPGGNLPPGIYNIQQSQQPQQPPPF